MTQKDTVPELVAPIGEFFSLSLEGKDVTLPLLWEVGKKFAESSPQSKALGFNFVAIEERGATISMPYNELLIGDVNTGVMAGGAVTTLLDHTSGLAAMSAFKKLTAVATLDLRIDYMRAATPPESIIAEARCYKVTRNVAFVRAIAHDGDVDDPIASAQAVFMTTKSIPGAVSSKTASEGKETS